MDEAWSLLTGTAEKLKEGGKNRSYLETQMARMAIVIIIVIVIAIIIIIMANLLCVLHRC